MQSQSVLAGLQQTIRDRMIQQHYPNPCGSIRAIIRCLDFGYEGGVEDGLEYLRLLRPPYCSMCAPFCLYFPAGPVSLDQHQREL